MAEKLEGSIEEIQNTLDFLAHMNVERRSFC